MQQERSAHGNEYRGGGINQGNIHGHRGLRTLIDPGTTHHHAKGTEAQVLRPNSEQAAPLAQQLSARQKPQNQAGD